MKIFGARRLFFMGSSLRRTLVRHTIAGLFSERRGLTPTPLRPVIQAGLSVLRLRSGERELEDGSEDYVLQKNSR